MPPLQALQIRSHFAMRFAVEDLVHHLPRPATHPSTDDRDAASFLPQLEHQPDPLFRQSAIYW